MAKWINIKEQLPPKDKGVLISDGKFVTVAELQVAYLSSKRWWSGHHFNGFDWAWTFDDQEVTHWAELPEPPFVEMPETEA